MNSVMIKIGDCLYPKNPDGFQKESYLVTNVYETVFGSIRIVIDNNSSFTYEKNDSVHSYATYFKTKQEMREEKLKKLLDL